MKFILPEPPSQRQKPRHCAAENCPAATREGKEYCTDHVEMHPYVQEMLAAWGQREADDKRAGIDYDKRRGRVNLDGITAQDMLMHLRIYGPRTIERLCRELNITEQVAWGYVRAMRRTGLVSTGTTKRGSDLVKLREG